MTYEIGDPRWRPFGVVSDPRLTLLLVEQNARLAFTLAHVEYVMEQGRVVLEGPSAEVATSEHVQRAVV